MRSAPVRLTMHICMTNEIVPHFHNDLAFQSSRSAPRNSCAWVRCHHKTIRTSSATWVMTSSMFAPIARPSIATTPRSRLTKHAQRNASFTASLITNDLDRRTVSAFAEFAAANSGE
jgi:hypothetical protein